MPSVAEQIADPELCLASDERFAALVQRRARFVFRVAYSVLRSVPDADDVVQDTFLKLYRSSSWERIDDEKAFLARTAWRIAVDQLRARRKDAVETDAPWQGPNPEQSAIGSDWSSLVCRLIDSLPEELRQPLALSSLEELNSREIANVMGIPEGTVRTRLMRARQILKQKLNDMGAGHRAG